MTVELVPEAFQYAPWSYSKVQTAVECPKLFHRMYINKEPKPKFEKNGVAQVGTAAHSILEKMLKGFNFDQVFDVVAEHEGLTHDLVLRLRCFREAIEDFFQWRERMRKKFGGIKAEYIEHEMAITPDFQKTYYKDPKAFYRGKADLIMVTGRGVIVIDHKSGSGKKAADYQDQLEAYSLMLDAMIPNFRYIIGAIHCLGNDLNENGDRMVWTPLYEIEEVRTQFRESVVKSINRAIEMIAMNPPAKPNWKCDYCDYRPVCSVWA